MLFRSKGICKLFEIFIESDKDFCLLLEDDWTCIRKLNISYILQFLNDYNNIGQVRLREAEYNNSITGYSSYNFVSGIPIKWIDEVKIEEYSFNIGNLHWTNNPSIFRRHTINSLNFQNYKSELDLMADFQKLYELNAQIYKGLFIHSGPWRIRQDLIKRGVIKHE